LIKKIYFSWIKGYNYLEI